MELEVRLSELLHLKLESFHVPLGTDDFICVIQEWKEIVLKLWVFSTSEHNNLVANELKFDVIDIINVPCNSILKDPGPISTWMHVRPLVILTVLVNLSSSINI